MFDLIGAAFLAGLVTGIAPCIVPVVPVIVAAGASGTGASGTGASGRGARRRPYAVVAGLVVSFTLVTLFGLEVLSLLHLPDDLLRWAGIALLLILGISLVIPYVGALIERPFAKLHFGSAKARSSGFVLGVSLGFVFVPCAGPVLSTITVVAASHRVGPTLIFMTLAYAIGACVPLLALALASSKATGAMRVLKSHLQAVRQWSGVLIVASAIALWAGLFNPLQTAVPGYTNALQTRIESSPSVASRLAALKGQKGPKKLGRLSPTVGADLMDYGGAPPFTGITEWLNTPGDRPLTLQSLRGKVVLVDFWTYSCINCERSLPHVEAWYRAYEKYGLVVVGVHTPEFAFEHVPSDVAAAAKKLGVRYPIAIDDNYGTWNAYQNQYWPAEYLIDQQGVIRREEFGEGNYAGTETAIRALLEAGGATNLPTPTDVPNRTPTNIGSPETYVGYERLQDESFVADPALRVNAATNYDLPSQLPSETLGFGGVWTVRSEEATAGRDAELEFGYDASDVYLVLGGTGTVRVSVNGRETRTVDVSGVPGLYTLVGTDHEQSGVLDLAFSPGVQAYDFTFG